MKFFRSETAAAREVRLNFKSKCGVTCGVEEVAKYATWQGRLRHTVRHLLKSQRLLESRFLVPLVTRSPQEDASVPLRSPCAEHPPHSSGGSLRRMLAVHRLEKATFALLSNLSPSSRRIRVRAGVLQSDQAERDRVRLA